MVEGQLASAMRVDTLLVVQRPTFVILAPAGRADPVQLEHTRMLAQVRAPIALREVTRALEQAQRIYA
jgi:hypothetical protein